MNDHICVNCKYFQTSFTVPRGSEQKKEIFHCQQGHAPIAWFSGAGCKDYQSKQSYLQEQK